MIARALIYLESFAFFLFCSHEPLLAVIKKTAFKLVGHRTDAQFLGVFIGSVGLTIVLCVSAGIFLN